MQGRFRTTGTAIEPLSPHRDGLLLGARLLFWPLLALTLLALVLQFGVWREEYKFAGPFAAETDPPRASLMLQVPRASWWRQPAAGDDSAKPFQSVLELRIDGRQMGPPHTLHETIRSGNSTGFSHGDRK